jgi:hypothetical protein
MAVHDMHSNPLEIRCRCSRCITSGHGNAAPDEKLGKRAHAGASDADKVNRTCFFLWGI